MTTTNMSVAELLKIGEEDFDKAIKEMNMKNLMEMISGLQKEMAREQESFNSLSAEIQNFKERNSRQYKQISKDMMASQQRLTLLMNRSMKCFAQQNAHQSSNGSPLKRRNSAKGPQPVVTSSTKSSFIQRSRSLHAVNQLSDSESPSSEQPPAKPQAATETKPHYSMNKSHTPIIMKTGVNGNNNNNKVTRVTTTNNINFEPKNWSGPRSNVSSSLSSLVSTGTGNIKSGGGKESSSVNLSMEPGSVKRHEKNTTDGDGSKDTQSLNAASGSDSVSGGGGGGLYVKRRPAQQQQRVTTTTNISSSRFLPKSEPPPSSPPPTTASSSSSSAAALPPRPPASTSSSSFAKETRFLKSKPPVPPAAQVVSQSPLQMAQARKGLSKSQIITQDPASNSSSGFRGLPNVRLLAQSFGSSTALNVTPAPSTNNPSLSGNQTNTSPSRVVRSNSSAGLSSPTTASPSNRIFLNKGSAAGALQQISQEQPVFINGRPQQLEAKPQNKVAQSTAPNASGSSELEQARARLRTNRNKWETTPEASDVNGNAQVIPPDCSPASQQTLKSSEEEAKEQRITENLRVGGYVKKKDAAPAKPPGTVLPPSSPSVTIRSINSSTRAPTNTNNIGAPPPVTIVQHNQPSPSSISSVQSSQAASSSKTTSAPQPAGVTAKPPAATQNQTASSSHFISSFPKQQTQTSSTLGNVSKLSMSFASFEPKPSSTSGRIISTTAANIRRTKSREELQEIENQTRSNKDSLLKQIQARRRDDDDTTGGSNIKSMSKLSFSMPSLLLDGRDEIRGDGSKASPIKSSIVLPPKVQKLRGEDGSVSDDGIELEDEDKVSRMNLREWNPQPVLAQLYTVKLMEEIVEDISHQFISMEGLMEKLPMNKKKATLLKTWKRRFFRAKDGWLYYYETSNRDQPSESIQLMGGIIHDLGNRVLGIDDGRGRFLMTRCPTEKEYGQWKVALESQTADNTKATYVRPVLKSPRHASKSIVVVDLGSSAIRAGILGQQASLPELFIPSLVAVDKETGKVAAVGQEALKPEIRHRCKIVHPIRPSNKVDQNIIRPFNIEIHLMEAIFRKVFQDLKVNPADFWVMISTPQSLGDPLKRGLMEALVDKLNVKGVCMVQQALLSLYSYNATSGIIVDIGHRIEILPIFDGFVIEGGVARCPYGAQKVQESLTTALLGNNYKFFSTVEQLLVRYVMEESCYVAMDFAQEVDWCKSQPHTMRTSVSFRKFNLPEGAYPSVDLDLSRFKSPEGFFNVDMWEMDYPTLHKLVHQAIQTCPMDNRRHMWRAVFLSGGVTMLPGFAERLEKELTKLAPPGVPVEVHAAPQRYHAAYIGACSVALMPQFEGMAISREEWKKDGGKAFKKWQASGS